MIYLFEDMGQYTEELFLKSLRLLTEQRLATVKKYKNKSSQKDAAMAYLLLCYGLKKEYNISGKLTWDFDSFGKPRLREYPEIYFNLSHCHSCIACAISNSSVGVDVENIRTASMGIMRKSCTEEELDKMISLSKEERNIEFIKLWTKKESITKFSGEGIQRDFKKLCEREYPTVFWKEETKDYCFSVYGLEYTDIDKVKKENLCWVKIEDIKKLL